MAHSYRRLGTDRPPRPVIATVLPSRARFRAAVIAGWLPGRLAALFSGGSPSSRKAVPVGSGPAGTLRRLGAMLNLVPARLPGRSAYAGPGVFSPQRARKGRVALLQGCAQPVLAPAINAAAIRLLTRHGVEVVLAAGGGCCGALVHPLGPQDQALRPARANID